MRSLAALLLLLISVMARGQIVEWEELVDPEREEERVEELLEFFEWRRSDPLDINRARLGDWLQFPWLDAATAGAIIAERRRRGAFSRLADLQSVPELSSVNYRRLLPYLSCAAPRRREWRAEGRHRWGMSWPADSSITTGRYAGDGSRSYHRLGVKLAGRLQGGLVCEKDPGESSSADLLRFGAMWSMPWFSGRLCLGSFALESGRGLLFGRAGSWGRGTDPVAWARSRSAVVRPSISAGENGGRQGIAIALEHRAAELFLFAGRAHWDASVEEGRVTALQWSGLHRTGAESAKRDLLSAAEWGMMIQRRIGAALRLGAAWQEALYSRPLAPDSALENLYRFAGGRNWNGGLEARLILKNATTFAEWARSRSGGSALECGVIMQAKRVEGVVLLRSSSAEYHRLLGSDSEEPRNETGCYLALQAELPQLRLAASYDYSRNPACAWRQPMPLVPAHETAVMATWQPLATLNLFHRLRCRNWSLIENGPGRFGNTVKHWRDRLLWSGTTQMEHRAGRLEWRMRLEYHHFRIGSAGTSLPAEPDSSGWMLSQQLSLELGPGSRLLARYVFHDAPDYETRFYLYENDLPGTLTLPMLHGRGCRAFVLLNIKLTRALMLSAKWSWVPAAAGVVKGQRGRAAPDEHALGLQLDWRLGSGN